MPGFSPRSDWVNLPSTLTHIDAADLLRYEAGIANIDVTFLPCDVATTAAITLSGTGQTVDGVVITAGMRFLNKDDTTAANRGIYVTGAGAWARATDMATGATIKSGCTVVVRTGTIGAGGGAGTHWAITQSSGNATAVIGTDAITITRTSVAFDVDTTSGGVTRFKNTWENLLSNSRFDVWALSGNQGSAASQPASWFTGFSNQSTATTLSGISQVAGLFSDLKAVQLVFGSNTGDKFAQLLTGVGQGDWLTASVKMERVSGIGNIHVELLNPNFPFTTYLTSGTVSLTSGAGPAWVMFTGQVLDNTNPLPTVFEFHFQSNDGNVSTWKIHECKLQKGKGIANEWSPSVPEIAGSSPLPNSHLADVAVSTGNTPAKFLVYGNVPFTKVLLTADSFVDFMETYDDNYREFKVLIEQDSVGGHRCLFEPATIAWSGGIEPTIDPLPGSFSILKCAWLGTEYGLFIEPTVGIPPYYRFLPDPYKGTTLGIKMRVMRGVSTAAMDNAVNTLARYSTVTHRQTVGTGAGNNTMIIYAGKFGGDAIPNGAVNRGGGLDFNGGWEAPGGPVVIASQVPYQDATLHEYYHAEHDYYFPNGYGPETATTGPFAPYNGQTYHVLAHPWVLSCWNRARMFSSSRTLSVTTTNGSTAITSSAGFTSLDSSTGNGCGISGTGIPSGTSRSVTGGITNGQVVLTITSGAFTNADLGASISGTGLQAGTYISQIVSSTQVSVSLVANATASGVTYTVSQQVLITAVTDSSHATMSQAATASGTITATIVSLSNMNNGSALAEWYSQMRTSMKTHQVGDDAGYAPELWNAGGDSTVVTDFQTFVTHVGFNGG